MRKLHPGRPIKYLEAETIAVEWVQERREQSKGVSTVGMAAVLKNKVEDLRGSSDLYFRFKFRELVARPFLTRGATSCKCCLLGSPSRYQPFFNGFNLHGHIARIDSAVSKAAAYKP